MENTNFKFRQLLEESGLNFQEKFDLGNIFNCLSDERKIQIIDNWPVYLDKVLIIRKDTEEKRRQNIREALSNIEKIANDALLRQKEEEDRRKQKSLEETEIMKNAQVYDNLKRANKLQNLINSQNDNN